MIGSSAKEAPPVVRVESGQIRHGNRVLLGPFDLELQRGSVHLVVGPAGSGKSLLLRSLSGRRSTDLEYNGTWAFRGDAVPIGGVTKPGNAIAWVPQIRNGPATEFAPDVLEMVRRRIKTAFAQGAELILLDEPTRGLPQADVAELREHIENATKAGACVVIVTHDLAFARSVESSINLVVYGAVHPPHPANEFFNAPPSPMARELVERGNCAPPLPEPPPLPSTFHWILPGELAGCGLPGLLRDPDDDLFSMAAAGIELLVSTTETPVPQGALRPYGMRGHHLPIKDMKTPAVAQAVSTARMIVRSMENSHPVAIHCKAGLGRTGTMLACTLVMLGRKPDEAIQYLREINPRYLQTPQQEKFVEEFWEYMS